MKPQTLREAIVVLTAVVLATNLAALFLLLART